MEFYFSGSTTGLNGMKDREPYGKNRSAPRITERPEMPQRNQINGFLIIPAGSRVHDINEPSHERKTSLSAKDDDTIKIKGGKWHKIKVNLFPNRDISHLDIRQGDLGDCWLLAAIASILKTKKGSKAIKNMMVDNEDGTVTVRMFDGSCQPVYIRVRKTLPSSSKSKNYGATSVERAFWLTAFEKAASCFRGSGREKFDPDNASMANIEGGEGHHAYRMLLGELGSAVAFDNMALQSVDDMSDTWKLIQRITSMSNWLVSPSPSHECKNALRKVFKGKVSASVWKQNFRSVNKPIVNLDASALNTAWKASTLPDDCLPMITSLITNKDVASRQSGAVGSGVYSSKIEGMYGTIAAKLKADIPISFGTKENKKIKSRGGSAGEWTEGGMAGPHAYAVIDSFAENVMLKRKFIKAANPWGRYGRGYVDSFKNDDKDPKKQVPTISAGEIEAGMFWLEITDLIENGLCKMVYFAASPVNDEYV